MAMRFGPVPPKQLPVQDPEKVLLLAERWQRAAYAHERWATPAKLAYDMLETRQWTEAQKAEMKRQKRPFFQFNIIAPIVRLVLGYHGNNKSDITYSPGQDTLADEATADAMTAISKVIAKGSKQEFVDVEVFLDGLAGGRGFFDTRLDFADNDLGEAKTISLDPFTVYPDPDADTYDLNESASFMQVAKMISIDEIEGTLGKSVAALVKPWTMGQTPLAPVTSLVLNDEVTPVRTFGNREDSEVGFFDSFYSAMGDFVDTHRKTIRSIETQYKVRELRNVIIDLETGDTKALPDEWGQDKIQKALLFAESVGNPCVVQRRMVERVHWTTMVGDVIIYDAPSFYNGYSMTGYFPYFRRGVTRGMVEDLIDPQREKNKRRSARIEIESKTANGGWKYHQDSLNPVEERKLTQFGSNPGFKLKWKGEKEPQQIEPAIESKTANGGWKYHQDSLNPVQKANLQKFGSAPGVNIEWKGDKAPEQIQPNQPAIGQQRLEADADEDVRRISGVNESALGESDIANQSGKAIEARQRQATVSVQMYLDNFKRSKGLIGVRQLDIIQSWYTEPRIYRITGEDGKETQAQINQVLADPASGGKRIINDVTLGKYIAEVDTAPLSATFAAGQFNEMMQLLEMMGKAGLPIGPFMDIVLAASSIPQKQEFIKRTQEMLGQQGKPPPTKVSESINYKDLPPEGQVQLAAKAGLQIGLPSPQPQPMPAASSNVVPMPARG